jgi:RNA polymerase sigma-70 factor (ECF subfamily)
MDAPMDDAKLISRYREGDEEALGELYDRHAPAVYAYLCRRIGPAEADDVLQETFLQAAEGLATYRHRGRLRQWLLTVARSRFLDRLRRRRRRREEALPEEGLEMSDAGAPDPARRQEERELGERIDRAVRDLPEKQREVFLLRQEAGLPFREIAEMLEMPLNTALSHMHRALAALRAALADLEETVAAE